MRAEARRRFGDEVAYRRALRRQARSRERRIRYVDGLDAAWGLIRDAGRGLVRAPAFSLTLVLIMALGVGANATTFGVLDRMFLRPPAHIGDPDNVRRIFVHLGRSTGEPWTQSTHTYPDYVDWAALDELESTAAWSTRRLTVGHGEAAARIPVTLATASFFPTLRVQPALGRFFSESEDDFGSAPVAVLGYGYWQAQYGGGGTCLASRSTWATQHIGS